jgi:hypothetical protein
MEISLNWVEFCRRVGQKRENKSIKVVFCEMIRIRYQEV